MEVKTKEKLGQELADLWDDYCESMGEGAAYYVACEQLNIHPDAGWDLLARVAKASK